MGKYENNVIQVYHDLTGSLLVLINDLGLIFDRIFDPH